MPKKPEGEPVDAGGAVDTEAEAAAQQPTQPALTLSQDQFQQLLATVRESGAVPGNVQPPPEPELDLANDPNVWSWDRVRELIERGECQAIRFVPDENVRIGWNGLYVWVGKDAENVVPEMHYQVYMDSRRGTREAFANARATLHSRVPVDQFGNPMASEDVGWVPRS